MRRFGRDPGVLGRTLVLSGEAFTVIGVMTKELHGSWTTHSETNAGYGRRVVKMHDGWIVDV